MELNCKSVRPNLGDYAARKLAQPEHDAIDAHLDTCRECDRYLADISSMHNGFRHLPVQAMPPLVTTKLQILASRERSRQYMRLHPALWLRDKFASLMLAFDHFLRPYAVPATGGFLASCLCFSLIARTLELRPYLVDNDIPIGIFSQITVGNSSPFSVPGQDIYVQVTVDANGNVINYSAMPGSNPTPEQMERIGGWILYSTFAPAMRDGLRVSSKRIFVINHMDYQVDSRGLPNQD
jgi:hypothetical protein